MADAAPAMRTVVGVKWADHRDILEKANQNVMHASWDAIVDGAPEEESNKAMHALALATIKAAAVPVIDSPTFWQELHDKYVDHPDVNIGTPVYAFRLYEKLAAGSGRFDRGRVKIAIQRYTLPETTSEDDRVWLLWHLMVDRLLRLAYPEKTTPPAEPPFGQKFVPTAETVVELDRHTPINGEADVDPLLWPILQRWAFRLGVYKPGKFQRGLGMHTSGLTVDESYKTDTHTWTVVLVVPMEFSDWYSVQPVAPLAGPGHVSTVWDSGTTIKVVEPNRDLLQNIHMDFEEKTCPLAGDKFAPGGWCQTWTAFFEEAEIYTSIASNPNRKLLAAFTGRDPEYRAMITSIFGDTCPLTNIIRSLALRYEEQVSTLATMKVTGKGSDEALAAMRAEMEAATLQ